MTQPAGAKVDTDPDPVQLVCEQIDVVVATAYRSELLLRFALEGACCLGVPARMSIPAEERVIDAFVVLAAYSETEDAEDVVHDRNDAGAQICATHIREDCFVATVVNDHAVCYKVVALVR